MSFEPRSGPGPDGSGEGSTGVQERVMDTARGAGEQVQEKAQEAGVQARERVSSQVDQKTTDVGQQMRSVADALRRTGGNLREEGNEQPATVVDGIADRVERFGGYLANTDANGFMRGIEDFGRRRPWALAGIGAVVGLAASRFLKASSQSQGRQFGGQQNGAELDQPRGVRPGLSAGYTTEPAVPAATGAMGSPTPPPRDPSAPGGI